MRFCVLLLSIFLTFGNVSAGSDVSKILTGFAVGVATGGLGYVAVPALGGAISVGEAVAAGVIAGTATAAGADRKVGINCNGNGKDIGLEAGFQTKEGREFTFRTNASNRKKLNDQEHLEREISKKFEESIYKNQMKDDIYFVFNSATGWNRSRLASQTESYDCVSKGDSKMLAQSGSRKWIIPQKKRKYDSFSTFTPADEDGRKAVESFIFEETPLAWHFGRKNINGQWYNHAWTYTNKDILIPEGNKLRVGAPRWYTKQRHQKAKLEAKETQESSKEIFKELRLNQNMSKGLLEEFLWSNVNAKNLKQENRIEESRKAVQQGLNYYDEANRIYRNMRRRVEEITQSTGEFVADIFLEGGMENFRKYANGELSEREYDQLVTEERLEDVAAIATGAAWGAGAGGAMAVVVPVVGPAAAPATAATGAAVGATASYTARRITVAVTRALERTAQTNFRKSQGNNSKDSQEPKMREVKGVKGKEKLTRENWRSLDKAEQREIRDGFFNDKVTNKEWNKPKRKIGGRKAWEDKTNRNIYYTKDGRHNDIEVWQVSGKKAKHLGSMEPIEGTMYKKPNHPPAKFE